jgi:hypothetical protein
MTERIILKAILVDKNNKALSEDIISSKDIIEPTDTSNFGYNQQEQLLIMAKIQQALLDKQVDFLKSETRSLSSLPESNKKERKI